MSFAGRTIAFDEKCTVKSVREENWKMLLKLTLLLLYVISADSNVTKVQVRHVAKWV